MSDFVIEVKLHPRAKKEEIVDYKEGILRVRVTAPPVDHAANKALIKLLASRLKRPKSSFHILKGEHSRNKAVRIEGLSEEDFRSIFQDCQSS